MSNVVAIRVEGLGKQYRIGSKPAGYKTFRDAVVQTALWPLHVTQSLIRGNGYRKTSESIWALKDVSFEIKHGEAVGIIGRNGAGKSTLLKILSCITEPTEGYADIYGRVGSLLEVGTGFHPELTGRENIYLNGAILGMRRAEIDHRFDEIVAFAEVEKFIDTPVKHYSSGMGLRLGFAIAAHLEPDILIVDEVLAVGDVIFQRKCLGKMNDVAGEGRTVLFVSHNMSAVERLCTEALLLDNGQLVKRGKTLDVVESYLSRSQVGRTSAVLQTNADDKKLLFRRVDINMHSNLNLEDISDLDCHIEYQVFEDIGAVVAIRIDTSDGAPVITLTDNDLDEANYIKRPGIYKAVVPIPNRLLAPGSYYLTVSAADMKSRRFDYHEGVLSFEVSQPQTIQTTFQRKGVLLLPISWKVKEIK